MQIWNPDYAFAYPDLSVNAAGDVAVGVAFGGSSDFADAAFGIIGDFVVWFQNASDAVVKRWGDYITIRRAGDGVIGSLAMAIIVSKIAKRQEAFIRNLTICCSRGNRKHHASQRKKSSLLELFVVLYGLVAHREANRWGFAF
jgi:hypothetical protein